MLWQQDIPISRHLKEYVAVDIYRFDNLSKSEDVPLYALRHVIYSS